MSTATQTKPSTLGQNKRIVRDFYELTFNQRQPDDAAQRYIGATYTQHNPTVGDGPEAFVVGITGWLASMPDLEVEIKRVVAEEDLVSLHSHFIPARGKRGMSVMDIFRLQDGKIVEHWDTLQDIPETMAHDNTMF